MGEVVGWRRKYGFAQGHKNFKNLF